MQVNSLVAQIISKKFGKKRIKNCKNEKMTFKKQKWIWTIWIKRNRTVTRKKV